jgi:hypothetical protein
VLTCLAGLEQNWLIGVCLQARPPVPGWRCPVAAAGACMPAAIQAIYQQMVDAGVKFALETPLPAVTFEDLALTSTRSAGNTGVRVQVLSRQPDGSWLRIIDRPEVPQP